MKINLSLPAASLCRKCDISSYSFETSQDLKDLNQFVGQDRAVEAIELGTELELQGFNLFILGNEGTGRHTYIKKYLSDKASERKTPSDWCYVNNFQEPHKPRAIELPSGKGRDFQDQIERLIHEAQSAISKAFESEEYHQQRQAIEKKASEEQENSFNEIQKQSEEAGFKIVEGVTGFNFIPLINVKLITP